MPPIRKILVPVDFSTASDHAAHYAVALARQLGAAIELIHVWEIPVYTFIDGAVMVGPETITRVTGDLQTKLDQLAARHRDHDVTITAHLLEGVPEREIGAHAATAGFDLIVMGTHGRGGLARMILGSVAERVVRTSTVPVLAVPPPHDAAA
jgi:nucleotide-binding universal stress UspA family protein